MTTARSNFSGFDAKPGASPYISHGMASMHSAASRSSTNTRPAIASSANCRAADGPSPSSRRANKGTKAELNAPSPNRRRNRFGKRNATTKASATRPVPNTLASRMSRMNPRMRLTIVSPPTVAKARYSFMGWQGYPTPQPSTRLRDLVTSHDGVEADAAEARQLQRRAADVDTRHQTQHVDFDAFYPADRQPEQPLDQQLQSRTAGRRP